MPTEISFEQASAPPAPQGEVSFEQAAGKTPAPTPKAGPVGKGEISFEEASGGLFPQKNFGDVLKSNVAGTWGHGELP